MKEYSKLHCKFRRMDDQMNAMDIVGVIKKVG